MKETKANKTRKDRDAAATNSRGHQRPQDPASASTEIDILSLQKLAGNQAVGTLLNGARPDDNLPDRTRDVLDTPGQPLDPAIRTEMESRFGHDFSDVAVHTDPQAQESARDVQANAYTVGEDIVFGQERYLPDTEAGKYLIAHELAHVVQQRRGGAEPPLQPDAPHEQDAGHAAEAILAAQSPAPVAAGTAPGLARNNDPELEELLDQALKEEGTPDKPAQPAKPGQPANVGPQKALTPEELLDDHVFGSRVEEEVGDLRKRLKAQEAKLAQTPNDAKLQKRVAAMRQQLTVLEGKGLDPKQTGTNVPGHGRINTRAAVQLVGPDGNIIAVERGSWHPDRHAEEDALQKLRKRLGTSKLPPGTRMNVAGNQYVCSDVCKPAVRSFAKDYGIDPGNIDATVRTRPKIRVAGEASPKTTERTGLRSDVPKGQVKTEPLFSEKTPATAETKPPSAKPAAGQKVPPVEGKTTTPQVKPPTEQAKTPPPETVKPTTPAPPKTVTPKTVTPKTKVPAKVSVPAGKIRLPSRGRLRSIGRGAAGAIASLVLQYFIGKWMAKIESDIVNEQIKKKQPEIEAKLVEALTAQSEELIKLKEANPDAEIYVNINFELYSFNVATQEGIMETMPVVEIGQVGYSLKPWGPTPGRLETVACIQTANVETLTVSDKVPVKELFEE